ncbi:MAG: TonB-dependent receptor [Saprospiraceae bacterium]|nr:TonB-dependent receptor [Saprospiraceae bacterium]
MKIGIRILLTLSLIIFTESFGYSQKIDSTLTHDLSPVTIKAYRFPSNEVKQLESVHQTYITSGKKHEVILVEDLPANIAEKNGRQIFAKISGAFIYDMDGSGNQVNVSTRGLDPHRSWEYNIRQNGIMTNSDIYGYPASHYSPPMEAINKIEIIRGSASLQYGSQFGGMINYITRQPDTTKKIGFESLNSVGSFGLQSTYNAMGGKIGKLSYYVYYQRRTSTGYRKNARSEAEAQFVSLEYAINPSMNIRAELGRSQYLYQIPGALTDAMFYANPQQSTRSRNYFSPDIYIPSLNYTWQITKNTMLSCIGSAVLGTRKSVQFIGFADAKDTIDALTREYKPRQVDIDNFNSYTFEARLQHDYKVFNGKHTLISGIRYINNDLHRRQQGKGTTGTDYDLTITNDQFGRDLHMKTKNIAFFAENLFRITKKLELSLGFRFESGLSAVDGVISYLPNEKVPQDISHKFPLFGISGQYRLNHSNKLYASWSQAYRPVIFADLIPATPLDQTDSDLKDAFGHNFDLGIKGELFNRFTYDLTFFQIIYKNRIGSLVLTDDNGQSYVWKTNFGDSKTMG